ncbi:GrpB family protein [Cytobacillus sp. IB215665]|uniref:GrpB family protein n=1 Tax=Cytobacillus sp. IB215665 TaxID=3097357 RepID=UPI002A0D1BFD|nr:GrpB family protein [Cytobacillus sp. IB215665]MDX8365365.1 GrpB family protein [Cytobacillus sp. IB215665]
MLGLPKGEVFLIPWTEKWESEFLTEKECIEGTIGSYVIEIHHIGSTAVEHLSAKPIIDIAIEIKSFSDGEYCVEPLAALGYSCKGTNILPDRYYYNKGEPRTHQIHMYQAGNKYLHEQLFFRDYLRSNEKLRSEYEQLKKSLANKNKGNKYKYAQEKTNFIHSILENQLHS